jgi:hypothetical protein
MAGIDVSTTAGSSLSISSVLPATENAAGFAAVTPWVKVARVTDLGEIEQSFTPVEFNDLELRDTYTLKGTRNAAELSVEVGRVETDAGQIAVLAAYESDNDYSFKIAHQDGSIFYFLGKVMSISPNFGDVNSITSRSFNIRLNCAVIEVAPTTTTTTTSSGA